MDVVLWVIAALLALAFLGSGAVKLSRSREQLVSSGMGFAEDFSARAVKGIGVVEILGAIGLILPAALDIAPVLTPVAAAGLALLMVGAVVTHVRRGETKEMVPAVVLLVLSALVAVLRFGPYSF